jgi:hypothetical protein
MLYVLGLGEYKCEFERTDMGGHVCGMIFVLDQNERNTFNILRWLKDRLSLSEVSLMGTQEIQRS